MANMYMKLEKATPKGGATSAFTGGDGVNNDGWFAVSSLNWGCGRNVGMELGNKANQDQGMMGMDYVIVSKEVDGASEAILSNLYAPGDTGTRVDFIVTKPDREGQGAVVYFKVELLKARICSYNISASEGAKIFETFSMAYNQIMIKHWNEDEAGKLEAGGQVTFDIAQGKAVSHS